MHDNLIKEFARIGESAKNLTDADLAVCIRSFTGAVNQLSAIAQKRELVVDWRISPRHNDRPAALLVTVMVEVA